METNVRRLETCMSEETGDKNEKWKRKWGMQGWKVDQGPKFVYIHLCTYSFSGSYKLCTLTLLQYSKKVPDTSAKDINLPPQAINPLFTHTDRGYRGKDLPNKNWFGGKLDNAAAAFAIPLEHCFCPVTRNALLPKCLPGDAKMPGCPGWSNMPDCPATLARWLPALASWRGY